MARIGGSGTKILSSDVKICGFGAKIGGSGVDIEGFKAMSGGFRVTIEASMFKIWPLGLGLWASGPKRRKSKGGTD